MPISRAEALAQITGPGGPFEIAERNVLGTTVRTFAVAPHTLRDVLLASRSHGDLDYIVYEGDRSSFTENFDIAVSLADWLLREHSVTKGERVAIAMRNYPEYVFFFWACQVLGAICVPLNAWWTEDELAFGLEDSGAVVLVVDTERLVRMETTIKTSSKLRCVVSVRSDRAFDGVTPWKSVRSSLRTDVELPDVDIEPDDLSTILYTSGTTGRSRGVMSSHRNHCAALLNTLAVASIGGATIGVESPSSELDEPAPSYQPGMLGQMPLFHISQLSSLYLCAAIGSKICLMYKWDIEKALDLIEGERLTAFLGVPLQIQEFFDSPGLESRDLSSMVSLGFVATAIAPEKVLRVRSVFKGRVMPGTGYGMTEATSAVTFMSGEEYWEYPDSVGRPGPANDIKVVDEAGNTLPVGEVGELWVRGPNVVRGYWNRPEETARSFTDGWHHSGDVAHVDDDGRVFVVDRIKDVVIRAGENIHTGEVEAVMYDNPAVHTVAVVGLPHERLGEELVALVRLNEGYEDTTVEQLQAHVGNKLAKFKVPGRIFFTTEDMPRTATGKIVKRSVRDQLIETLEATEATDAT